MSRAKGQSVAVLKKRVALAFDSVAEMRQDMGLKIGQTVETKGYLSSGDGGGNQYEIVPGSTGVEDAGSIIDLDNGLQAKGLFPNGVNVRQFGGVGANNIAPAISAALAYGNFCSVLEDDYVFSGEVAIPSNCLILLYNPRITMTLDGENARGFHFADGTENSVISGSAKIVAGCSLLGADGFRNAVFSWGPDYYVPGSPQGVFNCDVYGEKIEVECQGPENIKVVGIASYVDGAHIRGVRATGQSNFGFVAHWGGRGSHDVLTDATWHPTNIVFEDCEGYRSAAGSWLRSFTFSACGRCELRNCRSDSETISFNLFVGDYGFTYAQNLSVEDQYQYKLTGCRAKGPGALISADCESANLNGSPTWLGADHKARVDIDGLFLDGTETDTGLHFGITGLDVWEARNVEVYDPNATRSREWFYPQNCNTVRMQADVLHQNRARVRSTAKAVLNLDYRQVVPTPDATSYAVAMEGVGQLTVKGKLRDVRFGVATIGGSGENGRLIVGADFENIGFACVDSDATFTMINGGHGVNLGTTTTTANIYLYIIRSVGGFMVSGLDIESSEARYIVYVDNVAANGAVFGNFFGDLNAAAVNAAAVFKDTAANVYVDPNTNVIAGDVPLLVHP